MHLAAFERRRPRPTDAKDDSKKKKSDDSKAKAKPRKRSRARLAVNQQIAFTCLEGAYRSLGPHAENAVDLPARKALVRQGLLQCANVIPLHEFAIHDQQKCSH